MKTLLIGDALPVLNGTGRVFRFLMNDDQNKHTAGSPRYRTKPLPRESFLVGLYNREITTNKAPNSK